MAFSRITQGGNFTYNTVWYIYVFHVVRLIHRYRLNRRLCGPNVQSGVLEKRFGIFRYRINSLLTHHSLVSSDELLMASDQFLRYPGL